MSIVASAQVSDKKIVDKLSPLFKEQMRFSKPTGKGLYTVAVSDLKQFEKLLQKNKSIQTHRCFLMMLILSQNYFLMKFLI